MNLIINKKNSLGEFVIIFTDDRFLVYKVDLHEGYSCHYCDHRNYCDGSMYGVNKSLLKLHDETLGNKIYRLIKLSLSHNQMKELRCLDQIYRSNPSLFSISYIINWFNLKEINYEDKRIIR